MPDTAPPPFTHPCFQGWIGVDREDITPPIGIYARNWGAAAHDVAEGIHRRLTATALAIRNSLDGDPVIFVTLDLGWWRSSRDEWHVRGYLLEKLNLPVERLMLHFTHTHAGPVLCQEDADKPGGSMVKPYLDFLREAVCRAIQKALVSAVPAILEWSSGKCSLARNRDLLDPERPRFLCGFNPSSSADDTLLVGRVVAEDGRYMATLVNYACHPTTLAWENRLLSPDFVGAMREIVEAHTDQSPCLYLQGASGELAPREQYTADTSIADAHGRELGFAALSTLEGMLPCSTQLSYRGVVESGAPLAHWQREPKQCSTDLNIVQTDVEFTLQPMPAIAELNAQIQTCQDRVLLERLNRKRRIREGVGDGETTRMPLWVWQLGDAVFVGHPNEAYSLLQTTLREKFPGKALAVMNVVNGHFGYLPPAEQYDHDIYPVWQTPFHRGSLERLITTCEDIIQPMTDGGEPRHV